MAPAAADLHIRAVHGRTVNGSIRAELQHRIVNVDECTVSTAKDGIRQVKPMAKRLSLNDMADETLS